MPLQHSYASKAWPFVVTLGVILHSGCGPEPRRASAVPISANDTPDNVNRWDHPDDAACVFPKGADDAKIDAADVVLRVLVRPDGSPQLVQTLEEPGFGFGPAATRCAMARRYAPAMNEQGIAITAWTKPIRIKFLR